MPHRNTDAIIRIKNLRLRTFVGIKEEEINNKQDIVINVEIHYPAEKSRRSEDINDALNYRTITKKIIRHVEENRFALLEKLTQDVLDIASNHDWITYAEVEVDKLFALRYADSVSMTMRYYKATHHHKT
ncbi:dihydroneopterin triphosphate 2'-epimerase [Brenneria izadpanahii]|uniref:Dihydroneopterin triphosphate 2'-epimerase n=1 Tax=Brenneria izadpanahii TaxID=2722756 RepID=A0ABX7UPW0_9GAMM|nr:dihydroneopterin triphosphate 2'-epimerase [Brenneria izadpanahii]QTF07733.1 dihydroneopterin triphosphate 2'-epimerase [Brenneria izadpanahii]